MSQTFFIADHGTQKGPFALDEMQNQNINRETLVWTEGFDNWTKAEYVALLKDILRSTPPPIPNSELELTAEEVPHPPIPEAKTKGKYFGYQLASRTDRFIALILEGLIIWLPIETIFETTSDDPFDPKSIIGSTILSILLGAVLYPIFSGNLGHKIMGLKVISIIDGSDQNNARAGAFREGLKSISSMVLLPIIWLLWDDNKQNLYDKVVDTIVVKKLPR